MTDNKVVVTDRKTSTIPQHPIINGLIDLINNSNDFVVGHCENYVLLTDGNTKTFYRFDKTDEGYILTQTENQ